MGPEAIFRWGVDSWRVWAIPSAVTQEQLDRRATLARGRRKKNPEPGRKACRAWRLRNIEKVRKRDREAQRAWRVENPEKHRELRRLGQRKRLNDRIARSQSIKIGRGCADCGFNTHPEALDFDHLPGTQKKANVSALIRGRWSWERIQKEIDKCEVVCANCHRIRTAERRTA